MSEIEIELDENVAEWIRERAEKEGRTFSEQAAVMIREVLDATVSTATSDEPTAPSAEGPTERETPPTTLRD